MMAQSHWEEWLKNGQRDYVMMGAYRGDKKARVLVPDLPACAVLAELRAFLVDQDDPVERSIGKRVFLCLTIYDKNRKEAKVNKFPAGWEDPALTAGGPVPEERACAIR
jgi:hypothetical protein